MDHGEVLEKGMDNLFALMVIGVILTIAGLLVFLLILPHLVLVGKIVGGIVALVAFVYLLGFWSVYCWPRITRWF